MMQHRAQTGLIHDAARGVIRAFGEDAPAFFVQAHRRCDAPRIQLRMGLV